MNKVIGVALFASLLSSSVMAIELSVDTAKQAADLAGVKVPDALAGSTSSNTSTMGVAAGALGGGSPLGAAGALTGGSGSGSAMDAAKGLLK